MIDNTACLLPVMYWKKFFSPMTACAMTFGLYLCIARLYVHAGRQVSGDSEFADSYLIDRQPSTSQRINKPTFSPPADDCISHDMPDIIQHRTHINQDSEFTDASTLTPSQDSHQAPGSQSHRAHPYRRHTCQKEARSILSDGQDALGTYRQMLQDMQTYNEKLVACLTALRKVNAEPDNVHASTAAFRLSGDTFVTHTGNDKTARTNEESTMPLTEPKSDVRAPRTFTEVACSLDGTALTDYLAAVPLPMLCTYLAKRAQQEQDECLPDPRMDSSTQTDIIWDLSILQTGPADVYNLLSGLACRATLDSLVLPKELNRVLVERGAALDKAYARALGHSGEDATDRSKRPSITFARDLAIFIAEPLAQYIGVQLLIAGKYSLITREYADALFNLAWPDIDALTLYMLDPARADSFPSFFSALIFFRCRGNPAPAAVISAHDVLLKYLFSTGWNYSGDRKIALLLRLRQTAAQNLLSSSAFAARIKNGTVSKAAHLAAGPQLCTYWHATVMISAMLSGVPDAEGPRPAEAAEVIALLTHPVACTAPWLCWEHVACAIKFLLSYTNSCALFVMHTPPVHVMRFIKSLMHTSVENTVFIAFWLGLQLPQADALLSELEYLVNIFSPRHIPTLLTRLPLSVLARIPDDVVERLLAGAPALDDGSAPPLDEDATACRQACEGSAEAKQLRWPMELAHRLLLLRRSASPLTPAQLDRFFGNVNSLHAAAVLLDDAVNERPVVNYLSSVIKFTVKQQELRTDLLKIFAKPRPVGPRGVAQLSGTQEVVKRSRRRVKANDFTWPMYTGSREYVQSLAPFYFTQVLPRAADLIRTEMYTKGHEQCLGFVTHLLETCRFKDAARVMSAALTSVAKTIEDLEFDIKRFEEGIREREALLAGRADAWTPADEPNAKAREADNNNGLCAIVHNARLDVAIPLSLVERAVRLHAPGCLFTVRAYMNVVAALERLAVNILGSTDFTAQQLTHTKSTHALFKQLIGLDMHNLPFVMPTAASAAVLNGGYADYKAFALAHYISDEWYSAKTFNMALRAARYHCVACILRGIKHSTAECYNSACSWALIIKWLFDHPLWQRRPHSAVGNETVERHIELIDQALVDISINALQSATDTVWRTPRVSALSALLVHLKDLCIALGDTSNEYAKNIKRVKQFHTQCVRLPDAPVQRGRANKHADRESGCNKP